MSNSGKKYSAPTLPQASNGAISREQIMRQGIIVTVPVYEGMTLQDMVSASYIATKEDTGLPIKAGELYSVDSIAPLNVIAGGRVVSSGWVEVEVKYSVYLKGDSETVIVKVID